MLEVISNTSPLLYLYRIGAMSLLSGLFSEIWIPSAVSDELKQGGQKGYDVPNPNHYDWLKKINPNHIPSEWLASDLGAGELAAMALALEHSECIILLDDMLGRRTAKAAGLNVWGTLKVLLEAKQKRLIDKVEPFVNKLSDSGMWLSTEIRQRILKLADETD